METRSSRSDKQNTPINNSTPKFVAVSSRPGIHTVSPISPDSEEEVDYDSSPISGDSEDSDSASVIEELRDQNLRPLTQVVESYLNSSNVQSGLPNQTHRPLRRVVESHLNSSNDNSSVQNGTYFYLIICVIVVVVSLITGAQFTGEESENPKNNNVNIKQLKTTFPSQLADTWIAIESGINETKNFNKPSVFVVLHEGRHTEKTLHDLLRDTAYYASCVLNQNCDVKPIVVDSNQLVEESVGHDHGFIIETYKPLLQERAVFVLFDFDELPGELAQAFHTMCDEFTPLVSKTVYFFTVKAIDGKQGESDLALVERILRNKWSDLKDDIFYPLFTRVSSMVLRVVPEN